MSHYIMNGLQLSLVKTRFFCLGGSPESKKLTELTEFTRL